MNRYRLIRMAVLLVLLPAGGVSAQTAAAVDAGTAGGPQSLAAYQVVGDRIDKPLAGPGDAQRGYQLAIRRESACVLCHQLPSAGGGGALLEGGNIGPPLVGVGARLAVAQLRLRLVDSSRIDAASVMPSYHRIDNLQQVAPAYRGQPVLQAQQIEDVLAWLASLK